uniref:Uncharacterized protein n=1 Tax=uncultured organism MedDCM-OCT-S08-C169 TaxID=743633 RepID=D6PJ57_9ZZZZ|nr:hypothetical protein [uncultured organism MedDCM-OCT-S08-C169]
MKKHSDMDTKELNEAVATQNRAAVKAYLEAYPDSTPEEARKLMNANMKAYVAKLESAVLVELVKVKFLQFFMRDYILGPSMVKSGF